MIPLINFVLPSQKQNVFAATIIIALVTYAIPYERVWADSIAIAGNSDSLKRIQSYHLRFTGTMSVWKNGRVEVPTAKLSETEIWKDGLRRKQIQRAFRVGGANGMRVVEGEHGQVVQTSVDDTRVRQLRGWDPDHPFTLPLEFGRSTKEFGAVTGNITLRDPLNNPEQLEQSTLLWHIVPGFSLVSATQAATIIELADSEQGKTRLQLASTENPQLAPYVGTVVELDHNHGFAVSHIERSDQQAKYSWDVIEFKEADAQLFVPVKIKITMDFSDKNSRMESMTEVDICEINVPIESVDLEVQFPEGARVVEGPDLKMHQWGKDGPSHTFTSDKEFWDHIYAQARTRNHQLPDGVQPTLNQNPAQNRFPTLLVANLIFIALLAFIFVLRRRIGRSSNPTNG